MPEVLLYVPRGEGVATAGIAPGSAIIGRPEPDYDQVRIYFEGAVHGQVGMNTLADRAIHAWGRLITRYPTTASRIVPRETLIVVGTYEPDSSRIVLTGPASAREVAEWIGTAELDLGELEPTRFPLR